MPRKRSAAFTAKSTKDHERDFEKRRHRRKWQRIRALQRDRRALERVLA